jgi:short-subunit dehydrogenase
VKLSGASVLLTGATGGLGVAIARTLSERGASLVLSARRAEVLQQLAREFGGRQIVADLTVRGELERLLAESGEVDILVANAALPASGGLDAPWT